VKGARRLRAILCAVAIAAAFSGMSGAQSSNRTYLRGVVLSGGKPARSVWVIAGQNGTEKSRSLTGDDGRYYIGNLAPGRYDVTVMSGKNQLYKGQVSLPANSTFNIRIG
jgi:hypothetical protein